MSARPPYALTARRSPVPDRLPPAPQVFTIYNEILNPSKGRMRIVISSSISSGFLVYLIIATTGYLTFGDEIKDNILNSCAYLAHRFTREAPRLEPVLTAAAPTLSPHPRERLPGCFSRYQEPQGRVGADCPTHGDDARHFFVPAPVAPGTHLPGQYLPRTCASSSARPLASSLTGSGAHAHVADWYPCAGPIQISAEFFTKKPVAPQTRQRYIVETLVILAGTYGVSLTGINLSDVLSLVGAIGCVPRPAAGPVAARNSQSASRR